MSIMQWVGLALMAFCAYMLLRPNNARALPAPQPSDAKPPVPSKPSGVVEPDWEPTAHNYLRWLIGKYERAGLKDGAKSLRDAGRSLYEVPSEQPKQ